MLPQPPLPIGQSKAEEVATNIWAEEFEVGEDFIKGFSYHPNDFSSVKGKLKETTYEILDSNVRNTSTQMVELKTERKQKSFNGFLEVLEASEFTTAIHHNVALWKYILLYPYSYCVTLVYLIYFP